MTSFQSHVSLCRVSLLPLGEFSVMIPYHIAGCCHLANSMTSSQSHVSLCGVGLLPPVNSVLWSHSHIAGCKNSIRHIENRLCHILFSFVLRKQAVSLIKKKSDKRRKWQQHEYTTLFAKWQFGLWRAAAFVSSPIHLFKMCTLRFCVLDSTQKPYKNLFCYRRPLYQTNCASMTLISKSSWNTCYFAWQFTP